MQLAQVIRERGQSLRYLEGDRSLQVTMSVGIAEFGADGRRRQGADDSENGMRGGQGAWARSHRGL